MIMGQFHLSPLWIKMLGGCDQKIKTKLGCENNLSQNTIVQLIGLMEWQTYVAPVGHNLNCF